MGVQSSEVDRLVTHCQRHLGEIAGDERVYHSLPLAILDAVFSISAKYSSTAAVVKRYADFKDIPLWREGTTPPAAAEQVSVSAFLANYEDLGVEGMIERVLNNRQRTSTGASGITKGVAAQRWASTLQRFGIDVFQDVGRYFDVEVGPKIVQELHEIPGQASGISTHYFGMLLGDTQSVKPDRMIKRFVQDALGHVPSDNDLQLLMRQVCAELRSQYPALTPASLDYAIWAYQRNVKLPKAPAIER